MDSEGCSGRKPYHSVYEKKIIVNHPIMLMGHADRHIKSALS